MHKLLPVIAWWSLRFSAVVRKRGRLTGTSCRGFARRGGVGQLPAPRGPQITACGWMDGWMEGWDEDDDDDDEEEEEDDDDDDDSYNYQQLQQVS